MFDFIAKLYGFFATFPFIPFLIVYVIAVLRTRRPKEAVLWSVYITLFFLLSSVYSLFLVVTGSVVGFWILFFLLVLGASLPLYLQWRKRGEIIPGKVIRSSFFFGFFLFSLAYLILFVTGIINSMFKG